jgi:XTP/dITP diphosphohydrolase
MKIDELLIATSNNGKFNEFKRLLLPYSTKLISLAGYNIDPPEEYGKDFNENAEIKARYYYKKTGKISLSDDSGLMVDQLDGAPGVYSARWAGERKDFTLAINRVKQELINKGCNLEKITGSFICSIVIIMNENSIIRASGKVNGRIIFPPRGNNGFGYDPIFKAENFSKTYGEISMEEKEKSSHRTLAIKNLLQKIS